MPQRKLRLRPDSPTPPLNYCRANEILGESKVLVFRAAEVVLVIRTFTQFRTEEMCRSLFSQSYLFPFLYMFILLYRTVFSSGNLN